MTPDRESALRRIGSTWLGLTSIQADELWAEIDRLRAENSELEKQENETNDAWRSCRKERDYLRTEIIKAHQEIADYDGDRYQLKEKLAVALDALIHAHEKHDYCGQVEDAISKLKGEDDT